MNLENQNFDIAVEYFTQVEQFEHDHSKYRYSVVLSVAIKPVVGINQYWINLIADHLADRITTQLLSEFVNSEDQIVKQSLNSIERKLKLSSFLCKVQYKLTKEIRKKWKANSLDLINTLVLNDRIF